MEIRSISRRRSFYHVKCKASVAVLKTRGHMEAIKVYTYRSEPNSPIPRSLTADFHSLIQTLTARREDVFQFRYVRSRPSSISTMGAAQKRTVLITGYASIFPHSQMLFTNIEPP